MKIILGTMTFGQQIFFEDALKLVNQYMKCGYKEIDTAYVYNNGDCEKILGKVIEKFRREDISVATKVNPRITGKLDGEAVEMQLTESLHRMGLEYVDILYLHFPDYNTPLDSALDMCAKLYHEGKFKKFGLSNFPAWLVADVYYKCLNKGYMMPEIYEGLYNAISRKAEVELLDALENFNMNFYAYNPLAGGLLSGKYDNFKNEPGEGRFTFRPNYQKRYWKESFFDAVNVIKSKCEKFNIKIAEAALRWIIFHSEISKNDDNGVILGVSKQTQLKENMEACAKGELPAEIISAFDEGWSLCESEAPEYFRYYGK